MSEEKKGVHFKINGKEVVGYPGETVIAVAHREGISIPHYCYHPGLPIDGNCRMCIAKFAAPQGGQVKPFPKPMTTCTTYPTEGMEVDADSDDVQKMRRDIMEFLLINHPLDCPVCDQAGECSLQDYAFKFGRSKGRFKEEKNHKHTKNLGKYVALWGERCIVCTRCVRFLDNVSGTSEITVTNRGDRAVVDIFEGHPVDNPLSLNVVDVCPVGALVSRDFLFSQRVWFMKSKDSICAGCSKGCSMTLDYDEHQIRRVVSRVNPEINGYWLCDEGRMFFKHTHSEKRLTKFYLREKGTLEAKPNQVVLESVAKKFQELGGAKIALLGSLFLTCEAMYELKKLGEAMGVKRFGALSKPVLEDVTFPGFTIEGDKNPNRKGFEAIFGKDILEKGLKEIIQGLEKGEIKGLLIASSTPEFEPPADLLKALEKAEYIATVEILVGALTEKSHAVLAGSTYTEENGIYVHSKGKYQKLGATFLPPDRAEQNHAILQRLLSLWKGEKKEPVAQKILRQEMLEKVESFQKIEEQKTYPHLHNMPQGTLMNHMEFASTIGKKA